LLDLAAAADAGFDHRMFAAALSALRQITDADFDLYDIPPAELPAMRERFAQWGAELIQRADL